MNANQTNSAGRPRLWPHRLRGKLTILFLLLPSIAIGLVAAYAALSYRRAQREALLEEARTILALLVQHRLTAVEGTGGRSARIGLWAARVTELPNRHPRITYVMLRESSGADLSYGKLPSWAAEPIKPSSGIVRPSLLSLFGARPVAHVSAALHDVDDAFIQIGLEIGPWWANLAHFHNVAGILLITLLLNIWMIRGGLRRLITPLEELADRSRALAEGEHAAPVRIAGPEEVAQVAAAFNRMLKRRAEDTARIQATTRSLEELNQNLRQKHEDERRLQRQMAEQDKIATVGQLAAGIAHEINNPLDGLQNCLRRIVNDPSNTAQIERYAGLMTASLYHIEKVTKQLLHLSHKRDRAVREVSINELLQDAVDLAKAGQRWENITIDWRLSDALAPLLADPQNMTQVFLNLLLNAVDAMPGGGTITVATSYGPSRNGNHNDKDVMVEIADTGCGITAEVLPHVFEPFFTTKGHQSGTGLGLAVSRNLVIEHGGKIEVESTPEAGTTFRVLLPIFFTSRRLASAARRKKDHEHASGSSRR